MKEALLYEKLNARVVHCYLCAHYCKIANNKFGLCGVRENVGGVLYTHTYGNVVASHIDPIEKKPLYHFLPGSNSFSIATIGCNFRCGFCQNWEISQEPAYNEGARLSEEEFLPQDLVEEALRNDCPSISYTYTEPTIFFEYAYETAKLAKAKGLRNVFVTNGYMTKDCLKEIAPYLNAANVDLKFFKDSSYRKICSASLGPVLDSIKLMKDLGIWVEITTLVIPGENDSEDELSGIAKFISGVDKNIPWHVSRFHPDYKFTGYITTPEETLKKAKSIGEGMGLKFVYAGNVCGWGNDTLCPFCGKVLIKRDVFNIMEYHMRENKCAYCQNTIPGVF
ncbi:MAG: AmmeMemoRadiSam system radical SAM enzyme [Candidatus Omnitrophica bacterium CG08_land_8_20_14_0_20_41_16]|uniref:AmmeMemoRadiSam system radical SAM enzyme n=1 Tax=Candidatus Sherwoodlollariibacterium unditelluris TaxID=1974757 RepID=A0A2G9YK30_9BACT|nr:MAG: AmmeMemoRadiSam system radical SAM enzyme [Candidatus Omnitrophica bacterium CG23_combo_of_CG06-09_8_20_14_all_41_10]PIS33338.1 MAG: AmmeMemoRadiSam system radical SAM enzyme [Candidatus Omnitrophica bacterium CG08_land_8_20_14_0_20_41_16]